MFLPILQVFLCNFWFKRLVQKAAYSCAIFTVRIRASKQRCYGYQQCLHCDARTPPLSNQNVEADVSIGRHVAMVYLCREAACRWIERIILWEVNIQKEKASFIWSVRRSSYRSLPVEHVIANWACRKECRQV